MRWRLQNATRTRALVLCGALMTATATAHAADSLELLGEAIGSARGGDVTQLQLAIQHGASINTRNRVGDTLLVIAIKGEHTEYALRALEAGADPQMANAAGVTPLMAAAFQGDVEVVRALLSRHVALDATDRVQKTAMVYAAGAGRSHVVELLLNAGVPVNARYDAQLTALMWAAGNGFADTTRLLLQRGADPALADDRGKNAVTIAREADHPDIAELLVRPR
jgi:ankyrin repeat protein